MKAFPALAIFAVVASSAAAAVSWRVRHTAAPNAPINYSLDAMDDATGAVLASLSSATTSFFADGTKQPALAMGPPTTSTGVGAFGAYERWTARLGVGGGPVMEVSIDQHPAHPERLVFRQRFPFGANRTSTGNADALCSTFPSFRLPTPQAPSDTPLGYAHLAGYMAGDYPQYGTFTPNGSFTLLGGIASSGVFLLYSRNQSVSMLLSPASNFFSASLHATPYPREEVQWGVMGNASSLPVGFEASWILVAGAHGVNHVTRQWGAAMRTAYNRPASPHARDLTLQRMGYSTDNGAFYYYYPGPHRKNYQQLMPALKRYADSARLPYAYIQLDSWWYYRADEKDTAGVPLSGVTNWTAMPSVFPEGLPAVLNATRWPVMAHNRYWAWSNVYARNPKRPVGPTAYAGKKFEFVWGNNGAGLPADENFWDYLFSINSDWGLRVYEQDWLMTTQQAMPVLNNNVTFGRRWLAGMARGAARHGLTVQYCMSYPRHVLAALEAGSAVTQARASNDYQPETQLFDLNQWRIAESSMWVAAVGIAPSKDSYWSMQTSQYTPHYDKFLNSSEQRGRLESAVASMSNGPVQISDRIGFSNRTLIMRCCNDAGAILRPDTSASPLDAYFTYRAFASPAPNFLNEIALHGTHSSIDGPEGSSAGAVFVYVLAVNVPTEPRPGVPTTVPFAALPYFARTQTYAGLGAVSRFAAVEANRSVAADGNGSAIVHVVSAGAPLPLAPSNELSFQYWTLVPFPDARPDGWVLQGDPDKWIGASRHRFHGMRLFSSGGASVTVVGGVRGEPVRVAFLHTRTLSQAVAQCQVGSGLSVTAAVSAAGVAICNPQ